MKIACIGIGVMGAKMAGHLAKAGYEVTIYNRSPAKCHNWIKEYQGSIATSIAKACQAADVAIVCVGTKQEVREVMLFEHGVVASLPSGSLIIDHSTTAPSLSKEIYRKSQDCGITAFDAPVSGGVEGARDGTLVSMVGGDSSAFKQAKAIISNYTSQVVYIGTAGSGMHAKLVNQLCIAGILVGLCEGMQYGQSNQLPLETIMPLLSNGAAGSWQMKHRTPTMLKDQYQFGFSINNMIKDLELAFKEIGNAVNFYPNAVDALNKYRALADKGCGDLDTSCLLKSYQAKSV